MSLFKKISAAVIAGLLCFSMTACTDTTYAMTQGDTKIPSGIYILNQLTALNEAQQHEDYDSTLKNPLDNKIEDLSLSDWINQRAKELTKEYQVIESWFAEKGLSLDEEDLESIKYTVDTNWNAYSSSYTEIGIAKSSYTALVTNTYKEQTLFNSYYAKGGTEEISDEDLMAHFESDYALVKTITFSTLNSDGEAMSSEEKAEVETKAKSYVERANKGENMDDLIEECMINYAEENDKETPEFEEDADYMQIVKKGESSLYVSTKLNTAIFESAKVGQAVLLSDDNAYYVVMRYDPDKNEDTFEEMRTSVLYDLKGEDFDQILADKADEMKVTWNDGAIKKFKAKKLFEN